MGEDIVYITRDHEIDLKDYGKDAKELLPCPICGAKTYISRDMVDGYYFGWSVGCPRFSLLDNIHGIDINSPKEKHLSIHYLSSKEECILKWNEKVKNYNRSL